MNRITLLLLFAVLLLMAVVGLGQTAAMGGAWSLESLWVQEGLDTGAGAAAGATATSSPPINALSGNSLGYNNLTSDIVDIPQTGVIPPGYYPVTYVDPDGNTFENKKMRKIPYGYKLTADGKSIQPMTNAALYSTSEQARYNMQTDPTTVHMQDTGNLPASSIPSADIIAANTSDQIYMYDSSGNIVVMDGTNMNPQGSPLYYAPNNLRFSNTSFVPNYEQSVFLSPLTGDFQPAPYSEPSKLAAGFCSTYQYEPLALERECSKLDASTCGSTSCCVLLGGSKCVAGTARGPTYQGNYADSLLRDKDYYHYQGQCYGNCSKANAFAITQNPTT